MSDAINSAIDGFQSKGEGSKGGDAPDYAKLFQSTQAELQQTKSAIDSYKQELETVTRRASESSEVVGRLKEALSPTDPKNVDPTTAWKAERDYWLRVGIEAEKAGRPMPVTIDTKVETLDLKIKLYEQEKAKNEELKALKAKVDEISDPEREVDRSAFAFINSQIADVVERLYGQDDKTFPQRNAQFNAISEQVAHEIKRLQKEEPKAWAQVRRSDEMKKRLVDYVAALNQPPQVRKMLEEERLRTTPITMADLNRAFADAKKIENPYEREKATAKIRQEMWVLKFTPKTQRREQVKVGGMYGR